MITCQLLRDTLQVDDHRPEVLEHLRQCDSCLRFAMSIDPDVLFRSIGGEDLVPSGGVDLFAAGVMKQIELRKKSSEIARRPNTLLRWAAAAVITTGLAASSAVYHQNGVASTPVRQASAGIPAPVAHAPLANASVVESYASDNATIMEVPVNSDNDVKVVMIFDQSLPADL